MTETWVSTREFDGFSKRMDGQFLQVTESNASLHGKMDSLLIKYHEEARNMGAMDATVKMVVERLDKLEGDVEAIREAVANREIEKVDKRLGWVGQIVALLIVGVASAFFTRMFK